MSDAFALPSQYPFRLVKNGEQDGRGRLGLNAVAFLAGERSAYAKAYRSMLPSQQALGQLFRAVEVLHARVQEDESKLEDALNAKVRNETVIKMLLDKMSNIENSSIPSLHNRLDLAISRPAMDPDVCGSIRQLIEIMGDLAATHKSYVQESRIDVMRRRRLSLGSMTCLLDVFVAWSGRLLTKADVAAVFLSRRILIGGVQSTAEQSESVRSMWQTVLGSGLFIGLVEIIWQGHEYTTKFLPRPLIVIDQPLRFGLKICRSAVWAAGFILMMHELRHCCHNRFRF